MEQSIRYAPIGRVENKFDRGASGDEMRASESRIVLKQELAGGLEGITPGQQLLIVFHFDRSMDYDLLQHPRGDRSRPTRGVFALRSPRRPNPIGITQVEVLEVEGNVLRVHGLDAYNGTPVLDIKPA
jgi:tRNA-Thr(GGU) m(6)t(6)A37 methyltransferase TsaA